MGGAAGEAVEGEGEAQREGDTGEGGLGQLRPVDGRLARLEIGKAPHHEPVRSRLGRLKLRHNTMTHMKVKKKRELSVMKSVKVPVA